MIAASAACGSLRLVGRDRLDAGQADLAAIVRRKVRASITAVTRPSPCGASEHPAATAGSAAAASKRKHSAMAENPDR